MQEILHMIAKQMLEHMLHRICFLEHCKRFWSTANNEDACIHL